MVDGLLGGLVGKWQVGSRWLLGGSIVGLVRSCDMGVWLQILGGVDLLVLHRAFKSLNRATEVPLTFVHSNQHSLSMNVLQAPS